MAAAVGEKQKLLAANLTWKNTELRTEKIVIHSDITYVFMIPCPVVWAKSSTKMILYIYLPNESEFIKSRLVYGERLMLQLPINLC